MAAVQGAQRSTKKPGVKQKKARAQVHVDMTPLVDIAFLLLIFFLVTTVFRTPQTMELNIPPDKDTVEIAESNVLIIRMLPDGRVFWNIGRDMDPERIEFNEIQKFILDHIKENEKLVTLVKIARTSPYHQMVDIMDEMQLGSIDRFSITVMEQEEIEEVFGL